MGLWEHVDKIHLAIEDCVQRFQRPKLDYYDNHTFYVTHVVREENQEIRKEELDFFVGEQFIITFQLWIITSRLSIKLKIN